MGLQALILLAAIQEYGGKKKVTENLGTSVDTMNKYLTILENEVGYNLLVSDARGTRLTARAKSLVEHVALIEDIFTRIYDADVKNAELKGEVRVSMPLSVFIALPHDNIDNLFAQYPFINMASISNLELPNLNAMDIDIGLTYVPPEGLDNVIICEKSVKYGYFTSSKYISRHGYPKDFDDMMENHWLVNNENIQVYLKDWKNIVKRAQCIRYSSKSASAVIDIVRNGGGITLMPLRLKEEGLIFLDNIAYEEEAIIYLVAKKKTKDIPRVRAVIDYYRNSLSRM